MKLLICAATLAHLWYPPECCEQKDCHQVPCEQLTEHRDGRVEYHGIFFKGSMVRNSLDAMCHVCLYEPRGIPYCVFVQHNS
jgi:hypothetical protein